MWYSTTVKKTPTSSLSLRSKRVLLVGLGLHGGGVGTALWLAKQGARVRVTDKNTAEYLANSVKDIHKQPFIIHHLGGYRQADFAWADVIVLNPAVPPYTPEHRQLIPKNTPVANELTLFLERCSAKTVGITGTRGKTTTTLLLTTILKSAGRSAVASGNVVQEPMLSVLPRLRSKDIAVLELSSFQLELLPTLQRSPSIAILTNLSVDHLSRHGTMAAYGQAKANIFRYQQPSDVTIANADNALTVKLAAKTPGTLCLFSRRGHHGRWSLTVRNGWIEERRDGKRTKIVARSAYALQGVHQEENLLAAVAGARALGLAKADIRHGVRAFTGVPHRQEYIRKWRGHDFINDTAATSPEGALAAIDVFPNAVFILGGTDKQLKFGGLAKMLKRKRISMVFLPGTATVKLQSALRCAGVKALGPVAASMDEAVHLALHQAKPNQPIILSPGAASFGLFRHEFDRGDKFVRAVKELGRV